MEACLLCEVDLEIHNAYFIKLLKNSKMLVTNVKEFFNDYENINFTKPFNQTFESCFISGIYWTISSLIILNPCDKLVEIVGYDELIDIFNSVIACSQIINRDSMGFAPFYKKFYYSPTVLHTLHAVQILYILSTCLGNLVNGWVLEHDKMIINFLKLQMSNSNKGVARASYDNCINLNPAKYDKLLGNDENMGILRGDIRDIASLFGIIYILSRLTGADYSSEFASLMPKAIEWIKSCINVDCGVALRPGGESHTGACFCAAAINKMNTSGCDGSNLLDVIRNMKNWLRTRQSTAGGVCGHGNKAPDVCYSYWLVSAFLLANEIDPDASGDANVDYNGLVRFIHTCASPCGGFCKCPPGNSLLSILNDNDNGPDPYHSFKALAALLLIGHNTCSLCSLHRLVTIDPLTAIVEH